MIWQDTMLTETEKQAVEKILVENHDFFATHRLDIGLNTEFKVRLLPKDDKAVYSQSLPRAIHLKEDLIVELALVQKYGIITVLPFTKYASPKFNENPTGNYFSLWISGKTTPLLQMIVLTIITQSAVCQTQHNIWLKNLYSANLTALELINVCRWRTNSQWKCLLSILLAELLPTGDLQKVLADLCLPFRASCSRTLTHFSRLTNVFNKWMILESQPTMLRTLPGTFGQSSSAFATQDWNWQSKSAILEQAVWIPRQNHFIRGSITTNSQASKFPK